ncbi:hypothetical protein ACNKHK_25825 [Shigella flexneri]
MRDKFGFNEHLLQRMVHHRRRQLKRRVLAKALSNIVCFWYGRPILPENQERFRRSASIPSRRLR